MRCARPPFTCASTPRSGRLVGNAHPCLVGLSGAACVVAFLSGVSASTLSKCAKCSALRWLVEAETRLSTGVRRWDAQCPLFWWPRRREAGVLGAHPDVAEAGRRGSLRPAVSHCAAVPGRGQCSPPSSGSQSTQRRSAQPAKSARASWPLAAGMGTSERRPRHPVLGTALRESRDVAGEGGGAPVASESEPGTLQPCTCLRVGGWKSWHPGLRSCHVLSHATLG